MSRSAIVFVFALISCSSQPRRNTTTIPSEPSGSARIPPNTPITSLACREHAEIAYPAAVTACTTAADCIAVEHGVDCCGSVLITGIASSQRAAFDEIESRCRAAVTFRTCHCAAPVTTQLGESVTPSSTRIHVDCVSNACVAFASAPTVATVREGAPSGQPPRAQFAVTPGQRGPVVCAGIPCGNACCEGSQQCINGPVSPGQRICWPPPNPSCPDGGDCLQPPPPVQ